MNKILMVVSAFVAVVGLSFGGYAVGNKYGEEEGYLKAHIESMGETTGPRIAACKYIKGIPTTSGNEIFCLLNQF